MSRTLYFDCFCGVSGDMTVGALLDAGADFDRVRAGLRSLRVPGFEISAQKVKKHGIMATQFSVRLEQGHEHPHRHLSDILDIIEKGDLPASVKAASAETFRRIAECEATVHGTTTEAIHFHEVGAVDSIVDIVGAHLALHDLGIDRVVSSPLNVGSGTVAAAHGVLPVPAPATALLLKGVPAYGSAVEGELVTPTGAALVSQLAQRYGPLPDMRIEAAGYGCGVREIPGRANVLRVLIGGAPAADLPGPTEPIVVIEANIDDMNPELFPPLLAEALDSGARDAFLTPVLGKKGRPAYQVTVLCDHAKASEAIRVLFYGSTTLGVRMHVEERICLEREWKSVDTPWGTVRVKLGRFEDQITCASPEFEECRRVAEQGRVPVLAVYEAARAAAIRGEMNDA